MNAFEFRTVPTMLLAFGAASRLGPLLRERFGQQRLCVVTDKFLHASGLLTPALDSLQAAGWQVQVIDDVVADPPQAVVLAAAAAARRADAQLIVGIGGGSAMDVAKLIAVLAASDQPLQAMYGIDQVQGPRLPLVQIPTTAGTGSEVTPIAIITTGGSTKAAVVAPQLYADLTILDAELTLGLPSHVTAATGIDAIVHAIEAYTSKHKKNPLSDMLARQALTLLCGNLLPALRDGSNRSAREALLLGAMLAGQAFANAPVAAVHALAYPIGGMFHVPHGLSNALVLPHVLRFNAPVAAPLYAELAQLVLPSGSGSDAARTEQLIDYLEQLARESGIERQLRQVGIAESDLEGLTQAALQQTRLLMNNPREINEDDIRAIYRAAY